MPKMQGTVWTAVQPHGSENRDRTASHMCGGEKTREKKKKRKGKGEETYGCKERKEGNNNKKIKNHN